MIWIAIFCLISLFFLNLYGIKFLVLKNLPVESLDGIEGLIARHIFVMTGMLYLLELALLSLVFLLTSAYSIEPQITASVLGVLIFCGIAGVISAKGSKA